MKVYLFIPCHQFQCTEWPLWWSYLTQHLIPIFLIKLPAKYMLEGSLRSIRRTGIWPAIYAHRNTALALGNSSDFCSLHFFVCFFLLFLPLRAQKCLYQGIIPRQEFQGCDTAIVSCRARKEMPSWERSAVKTLLNSHEPSIEDSHYLVQTSFILLCVVALVTAG